MLEKFTKNIAENENLEHLKEDLEKNELDFEKLYQVFRGIQIPYLTALFSDKKENIKNLVFQFLFELKDANDKSYAFYMAQSLEYSQLDFILEKAIHFASDLSKHRTITASVSSWFTFVQKFSSVTFTSVESYRLLGLTNKLIELLGYLTKESENQAKVLEIISYEFRTSYSNSRKNFFQYVVDDLGYWVAHFRQTYLLMYALLDFIYIILNNSKKKEQRARLLLKLLTSNFMINRMFFRKAKFIDFFWKPGWFQINSAQGYFNIKLILRLDQLVKAANLDYENDKNLLKVLVKFEVSEAICRLDPKFITHKHFSKMLHLLKIEKTYAKIPIELIKLQAFRVSALLRCFVILGKDEKKIEINQVFIQDKHPFFFIYVIRNIKNLYDCALINKDNILTCLRILRTFMDGFSHSAETNQVYLTLGETYLDLREFDLALLYFDNFNLSKLIKNNQNLSQQLYYLVNYYLNIVAFFKDSTPMPMALINNIFERAKEINKFVAPSEQEELTEVIRGFENSINEICDREALHDGSSTEIIYIQLSEEKQTYNVLYQAQGSRDYMNRRSFIAGTGRSNVNNNSYADDGTRISPDFQVSPQNQRGL